MESFFSSLKTERIARKTYRTRDEARANVFDDIERFYNAKRRRSTIGYRSPRSSRCWAGLALGGCPPNQGQAKPLTDSHEIGVRHCLTHRSREFDVETGNPLRKSAHAALLITRPFFLRLSV